VLQQQLKPLVLRQQLQAAVNDQIEDRQEAQSDVAEVDWQVVGSVHGSCRKKILIRLKQRGRETGSEHSASERFVQLGVKSFPPNRRADQVNLDRNRDITITGRKSIKLFLSQIFKAQQQIKTIWRLLTWFIYFPSIKQYSRLCLDGPVYKQSIF